MEIFFHNILIWLESSKYVLLFLGCIFEGPVVMMASGFLFSLGQFDFLPMYLALVSGDFVADIGWYLLGRYGGQPLILKWGHKFGITPESIEKIKVRFHRYHEKILIISKLTMGFGFALVTLITAGIVRIPFKKYVILNLVGGFIWTIFLLSIGYLFGNIYSTIPERIKIVFLILGFIAFITTIKLASNYFSKKGI